MNFGNYIVNLFLQQRVLRHILFWIFAFLFTASVSGLIYKHFEAAIVEGLLLLPPRMAAAYLVSYYIIPQLILKRKYLIGILVFLASFYVLTVISRILIVYAFEEIYAKGEFHQEPISEILTDFVALFRGYFLRVYVPTFFIALFRLIKAQFEEKRKREQLENEKIRAELNFLRAQIHPHFLFNTLNNLYALTLKKSDKAPEMLLKLSDMLDYMLYQCSDPSVPIRKELELLHNYIELEKLRYGERLDFRFETEIDDDKTQIAPLLLLSLVENAFKHGASGDIGRPRIEISLRVQARQLDLHVFNTKPPKVQSDDTGFKKGIGASNVKRQLDLIYPGRHRLENLDKEGIYAVNLSIDLNAEQA